MLWHSVVKVLKLEWSFYRGCDSYLIIAGRSILPDHSAAWAQPARLGHELHLGSCATDRLHLPF